MDNIDPQVKNLVSAIGRAETGDPSPQAYQQQGKSGEFGRYQFRPDTYKTYAQKYLGDANAQPTIENQNKIAYSFVKEKKDAGFNPAQIASMWNAGEDKPNAYKENYRGVNQMGVAYDTPAYAQKVSEYYNQMKGQTQAPQQIPNQQQQATSQPTEQTLGSELIGRSNDAATGLKSLLGGKDATGQTRASGLLQTAGAVAGAVGDVTNKILEVVPGVKWVEKQIGKGVGALAQTEAGQSVIMSMHDFAKKHPEVAKDMEAGFNIVTAIPVLKGLSVAKNVALDASAAALKNVAEKSVTKDLTAALERTVGGRTALKSAPNSINTLVSEGVIPDINDGKFSVGDAYKNLSKKISNIEDTELQPALAKASGQAVAERVPVDQLRQEALDSISQQFKASGNVGKAKAEVNRVFDDYKSSYGDYVTLQDINEMKRGIRKSVNFASPKLESDVTYHIGQTFMKNIENSANKLALGDVKAINAKMADLIKAQQILKYIEGKPVKSGLLGEGIKGAATIGGEMAGNVSGIPLAGTLAGRQAGRFVGRKFSGISRGILERAAPGAEKVTLAQAKQGAKGLLGGALAQKAVSNR